MSLSRIENGWFCEVYDGAAGYRLSLEVEEILYQQRSKFQDILLFTSKTFGNVLVLDGIIQCTERDEFAYQEMIAHLPLNSHPNPQNVLVIGGGDGGVVREVLKHPSVKSVTLCEIDEKVIEVSKKYLPHMACAFSNPKLQVCIADGAEYLANYQASFDVIITDSPDPIGPAKGLFATSFYELVRSALKTNGIMCSQAQCLWLDQVFIKKILNSCRLVFPCVSYAYTTVPTYAGGQIGFILCSMNRDGDFSTPIREWSVDALEKLNLKYYNSQIHRSSFVLPHFAQKAFGCTLKT